MENDDENEEDNQIDFDLQACEEQILNDQSDQLQNSQFIQFEEFRQAEADDSGILLPQVSRPSDYEDSTTYRAGQAAAGVGLASKLTSKQTQQQYWVSEEKKQTNFHTHRERQIETEGETESGRSQRRISQQ